MAIVSNTADNVSAIKGVQGGYLFIAPAGSTLPTDQSTALDAAFKNLGYVNADGVTVADSTDTETVKDMNGTEVDTFVTGEEHTLTFTLMEYFRLDALKFIYGDDAVTSASGTITIKHHAGVRERCVLVGEFLTKDGGKYRMVCPSCQVTEIGDLKLASGELAGRELTVKCYPSGSTAAIIDYLEA